MIVNQLKARSRLAEPVSRELAAQFQGAFQHYRAIRDEFLAQLPSHLHASELVTLINVELKSRLFHPQFCEQIQEALKGLRRTLIRLEDLRSANPDLPPAINDLERLSRLGERAEALYQRHWEYYRYPTHLNEETLAGLLMDIHRLCGDWDEYFARFSAVHALIEGLTGQALPAECSALRVTYTQAPPLHFSVGMLKTLLDFLESGYGYAAALSGVDAEARPLALLHVDVADPVELVLAVPTVALDAYAAFLQYLFLKDMLKREALLKYVFEAVEKNFGRGVHLDAAAFLKDLSTKLKALPSSGRFTISDRTFPDDQIAVLHDFTAVMERNRMEVEPLLNGDKPKASRKSKAVTPEPAPKPVPEAPPRPVERRPAMAPVSSVSRLNSSSPPPSQSEAVPQARQHLHILTERLPD